MKITRVGMYVNVAMAATKGAVGLAIHSNALIADAAHSLSDLLSDVVTLWSVKVARLPPDPKHPYGYGKYEAVGSLSVGAILVLCGLGIGADGFQAIQEIWNGTGASSLPEFTLPFLSDIDRSTQWALAAGAAGVSIAAKEALFHATVKIGKQANSKVLIANAWHHRTDAISSVVALGGIIGSMAGVPLLDPVAGMAVAAMIVKTGGDICLDRHVSVQELTDNTVEAEVLETLKEVSAGVDDVLHVSQVRARRMGPYTLVDLRVHLHARTSISMAQQISERVRSHILHEVPDVTEVLVHIDVQFVSKKNFRPYREIKNDISYALATIPKITGTTHINTHWLPHLGGRDTAVDVTIVVQPDLKVGGAHAVAKKARKYVRLLAIEAIPYIVEADIHLELQDDDGEP
ncbi:Cation Diffusion Facilitator (CDF) Family [Phytophthora infestans T30-4]|uniref:Cation Diffusion Facilitator (CDF) Family n=1 Tax=Phytophthora infestans (strain T30-4) TaxID=403677 RepID=D0MSA2_PHYIT|nr:Cation Diffusion Facilitator (CDF) Family [Phytophthora infestans T30-4]EEY58371.1 Cation Diffusion Facilitator (CDF) Family [Phytophthora infestans T30-4]|eukprot:XP_002909557.1 Cation Diffusion Facilitator (CDF) Family [Phytophthora infestans T30-4]